MNVINEEIRAIQHRMTYLEKVIPLCSDTGEKQRLKDDYNELDKLLSAKLIGTGEF